MRKILLAGLGLAAVFALMIAPSASALVSYTGSLSTADGGIIANGLWAQNGFQISWNVSQVDSYWWKYEYWLRDGNGNLLEGDDIKAAVSHFTLEVSPGVTYDDFRNANGSPIELSDFSDQTGDAAIENALKFDFEKGYFSIESIRIPTWGDFYAKDGWYRDPNTGARIPNNAWNAGYALADPLDAAPADGAYMNKLLRPDTQTAIPEPGTMLLFGLGLAGAGVYRRVKNKIK